MTKELFGRDRSGRMVRIVVDDAAEALLRQEAATLSSIGREIDAMDLRAAAERCVNLAGFIDEDKVAAFGRERGLGYSEARVLVSEALTGSTSPNVEERNMAKIRGYADRMGLSFSEAATQLSEQGVDLSDDSDAREPGEVALSGDDGPSHEQVLARARRDGVSYAEAASALAGEL